jgi:hypothetical protein
MRTPEFLLKQAQRCRRWASQLTNAPAAEELLALAAEYESEAAAFVRQRQSQESGRSNSDNQDGEQQQS